MKRAIFPGSFDPFTIGHESLVKRALKLFDEIIIGIGYNTTKNGFFSVEIRKEIIEKVFENYLNVKVELYSILTVDFCKSHDINFILRGLRTASDFEYECAVAQMNRFMDANIETVFLLTEAEHTPISSTVLREILKHNGDISRFIPKNINIKEYLK